jgi:hypothetical protein
MFKIITSLILVLLSSNLSFAQNSQENISKCEKILSDLKAVISSDKSINHEPLVLTVNSCFDNFKNKKLGINISESIPKDIYGGTQFLFAISGSDQLPAILISPYMLDIYDKHPSIVLSALVHEMQHAKSYFDDTEYFKAMHDVDLERYLYELDALHTEANFISNYLLPNNYKITDFEQLLSKSFKKDYLGYYSFVMMGFDMELTFELVDTYKNGLKYEENILKIKNIINKLLESEINEKSDDWAKYQYYIPLHTAVKFIPQVVRTLESNHSKIKDQKTYDLSKQNPEIFGLMKKLEQKAIKDAEYYKFISKTQTKYKEI